MSYEDDPQAWQERLTAKLAPDRIRSTLAFAGLYQMTHELIKHGVLEEVKGFYGHSDFDGGTWMWGKRGEETYTREVLALTPKKPFRASLQWLKASNAITPAQVDRLEEVYEYRHELTHELMKFVVDVEFEPNINLLTDAVHIMRDISRFWVQIEKDIGTFDKHGDINIDDVHPGTLLVLDMCIEAYVAGLPLPPSGTGE